MIRSGNWIEVLDTLESRSDGANVSEPYPKVTSSSGLGIEGVSNFEWEWEGIGLFPSDTNLENSRKRFLLGWWDCSDCEERSKFLSIDDTLGNSGGRPWIRRDRWGGWATVWFNQWVFQSKTRMYLQFFFTKSISVQSEYGQMLNRHLELGPHGSVNFPENAIYQWVQRQYSAQYFRALTKEWNHSLGHIVRLPRVRAGNLPECYVRCIATKGWSKGLLREF